MRYTKHRAFVLALAASLMLGAGTVARATECMTEYSWTCSTSGGVCKGNFNPTGETFSEVDLTFPYTGPFELFWVLRFGNLPKGVHKLRTGYAAQDKAAGNEQSAEIMEIRRRQATGCTEDPSQPFAFVQNLQNVWNGIEWESLPVTDYDLGVSGTTDICLRFTSLQTPPSPSSLSGDDEFILDSNTSGSPFQPAIVTTLDTNYTADSETIAKGTIVSGSYTSTRLSDDQYEVLKEGGTQHQLRHVWAITKIPAGSSQTIYVEGSRVFNLDGDNFDIRYKWVANGTACNPTGPSLATGIIIDSESETVESAAIGNSSGTLCVQIADTAGGGHDNEVKIDNIYVVTASPACP